MSDPRIVRIGELLARFSEGDPAAIDELVAPVYFVHVPSGGEPSASAVYRTLADELLAAAPDLRIEIPDLTLAADDVLTGEATVSGTWSGQLWGAPPTGEHYEFHIPVRVRSAGDRFAFEAGLDTPGALLILRALGLVNPPGEMHLPSAHPVVIPDVLMKVLFTGQVGDKQCAHLQDTAVVRTDASTCDDCAPDAIWPALRMCLACGHVGCCDTSTGKHAKGHWETTGHPLIRSIRLDEGWIWCYKDNAVFQKRTLAGLAEGMGETL